MPKCLKKSKKISYHYQIVNLHNYLQIIFIIYLTGNFGVLLIGYCFIAESTQLNSTKLHLETCLRPHASGI